MMGIMQSTTPPIEFTFKQYNVDDIVECYLTIKQDGVKIEKNLDEAVKKDSFDCLESDTGRNKGFESEANGGDSDQVQTGKRCCDGFAFV